MPKQDMLNILKLLATPIDFEGLIADGVLRKSGHWYTVLKPDELPQHAWKQAYAVESGNGKIKVKFRNSCRSASKLYEKIAGEPMDED